MDPQIYKEIIEQEESHWWFRTRRTISRSLLSRINIPRNAVILEAGCGAGGNLPMLSEYGNVYAFEMEDSVRNNALARNIGTVESGSLPNQIPFVDIRFDLIAMFDVLEHIPDDLASLHALKNRLNPGGILFITVPAFQTLYSEHDKLHHHCRRYNRKQLKKAIEATGLTLEYISYWNCLLLPVAALARFASKIGLIKSHTPGAKQPAGWLNNLLYYLVASEQYVMKYAALPFGLSLIAVARNR